MTAAWRSEILKITTVRGLWLAAALAVAAIPATSLLVVGTGGLGAADTATSGAATGSMAGLLAFGAWGAILATSEYANRTMAVTLATVPRRAVLYGAKLAAAASVAAVGALVAAVVSLLTVLAVTPSGQHDLGHPDALVGIVLAVAAVAVVGVAVGMLVRSSSASIAIVAAALLLPKLAGSLLGGLQRVVVGSSPGTVITQLVGGAQLPADQTYPGGAGAAAATLVLVTVVVALAGFAVFTRRDG
jgi:ABC-type transport system involved in multi-copper enzyme maturation permease subunit